MKKILVGYAGSVHGDKTSLEVAKQHAAAFKAKLMIVSSLENVAERNIDEMDEVKKHLAYVKDNVEKAGIECETHVLVRGLSPGEDLVNYAKENKVDEIIIGIEKKSKVGKFLFGSNAQFIILEAPCPVVCVKQI
ncbi:MAG: universal stress protein [Deltaproteobacteria bacterium]|nr:universal stress protein [Deltaproteobacteria bacterium]